MMRTLVSHEQLDIEAELAALTVRSRGAGGVVNFVGLAREECGRVAELALEYHPILTKRSLEEIGTDAENRFAIDAVSIVHRAGIIMPGEPIVFAGAAARHRRDAFLAADYIMDMLKTKAVFWKREHGSAGKHWIEPRDEDHADAARWNKPTFEEGAR